MMLAPTRVVLVAWCACSLSVCACAPTPVPLRDATFSELVQLAEKHADSGELESAVHTLRIAMEHIGTGHSIEDGASHRGNKEHAAVATRLSELLLELAYERIAEEHPMADPDDETLETELRREALAAAELAAKLEPTSEEAAEALAQSMPSWASGASAVACGAATNSSSGSSTSLATTRASSSDNGARACSPCASWQARPCHRLANRPDVADRGGIDTIRRSTPSTAASMGTAPRDTTALPYWVCCV